MSETHLTDEKYPPKQKKDYTKLSQFDKGRGSKTP